MNEGFGKALYRKGNLKIEKLLPSSPSRKSALTSRVPSTAKVSQYYFFADIHFEVIIKISEGQRHNNK